MVEYVQKDDVKLMSKVIGGVWTTMTYDIILTSSFWTYSTIIPHIFHCGPYNPFCMVIASPSTSKHI